MPVIEPNNNAANGKEKCRSCVDFKSWAKQQRKSLSTTEVVRFLKYCENHVKFMFCL